MAEMRIGGDDDDDDEDKDGEKDLSSRAHFSRLYARVEILIAR